MELRALAEQILFATTLEEKLQSPKVITDDRPGLTLATPKAPGRPHGLHFKGSGQADFPGIHRLDQERERGRLLHFFANHELLATELMALVLLRFPEAPKAFRLGVLKTLKDEQRHTRLYLRRMRECGIQFGDLPVSGYFWRTVSTMESPIDYVAGLSLTFEQANLDFCRHFSRCFEQVGDRSTARLLEGIYRDEIGHVAYGLNWFRRWKNPDQSDWEAFCRQLKFPLSPQRAKGISLNVQGRQAAGLDPEFIAELNVYSQSKGRTPNVFVFNPLTEGEIAQGRAFTPGTYQATLARDLANLPQFLCRQDDIVLVPQRPSVEFLSGIKQAGFDLPEFVELPRGTIDPDNPICQRKLGRLRPWAWGPDSVRLFTPLFPNLTVDEPKERFNERIAQLYSKAWSADFLRQVLRQYEDTWLCTEAEAGVQVDTLEAALKAIATIRKRGHHKIVIKQALGLAGQHSIRLWEPELLETQKRWMVNAVDNGRPLVVEPWLDRELDFSVQMEMGPQGLKLCGFTGLINDAKGQYQANWALPDHPRRIPAQAFALLQQPGNRLDRLRLLYDDVRALLQPELQRAGYQGPLGIDALVYRTPEGLCRLKPIVEINPRYTMGRLTLELLKRTCQGCRGLVRLVSRTLARKEGHSELNSYAQALIERYPLAVESRGAPRIREGALCLNDPARAEACLAIFQVDRP